MGVFQWLRYSLEYCTQVHWFTYDTLTGRGKPMIPSVASLLDKLSPKQGARECLPMFSILYMAPGGHRQWPMSITTLLDRLSWIALKTRPLALSHFQEAVQKNLNWKPRYHCGPKVALAPSIPFKFLDIGTKMGNPTSNPMSRHDS